MEPTVYAGLEGAHEEGVQHLGGNIKIGDPYTYCPSVWRYVIERFSIRSVLDLGSGAGNASYFFHQQGMRVVAVEGFWPSVEKSLYPAILHDITTGPVKTVVDLSYCQEVVEHIEEAYLDNLMDTLTCGKVILITHALPGQFGFHHVNCQPSSYWIDHFARRGCAHLEGDTMRIRALAEKDGASYMHASGLLFGNRARL